MKAWHQGFDGAVSFGKKWDVGDVVGVAVDMDVKTMSFALNDDWSTPMGVAWSHFEYNEYLCPSITYMGAFRGCVHFGAPLGPGAIVGEEELTHVGKWSTNMALVDEPVSISGSVTEVTVSVSSSVTSVDWEVQSYARASGSSFELQGSQPFQIDGSVHDENQSIQLTTPLDVEKSSFLVLYCLGSHLYLNCTSKEAVKMPFCYGTAPSEGDTATLKTWSGRMGWSACIGYAHKSIARDIAPAFYASALFNLMCSYLNLVVSVKLHDSYPLSALPTPAEAVSTDDLSRALHAQVEN